MSIIDAPLTSPTNPSATLEARSTADWVAIARDVGARLAVGAAERDRTGDIAVDGFDLLRTSGLSAALVPVECGGGGATHEQMGAILRELGRHDGATAVTFAMHSHPLALQVWRHQRGMDASKVFQKVAGERALLGTTGASDWVGSNGSVQRVDGGYRVSARKGPVSGCEVADILTTSFRWDDAPDGPQVFHCALPRRTDGIRIERTWDTLGMRATGSHTLVFDDVFVPDATISLTRPADAWHPIWNAVLGCAMSLIMSAYLGVADAAVELAMDAVAGRIDGPTIQLVGQLGNAHLTASDAVDAMFRDAEGLRFENTDDHARRTLSRKTVAADSMIDSVRIALELMGGRGFSRSSTMERLQRDILGCRFHPLPTAKQIHFSGRVALGLSPIE